MSRWTSNNPLRDAQLSYNRHRTKWGMNKPKCNLKTSPQTRGLYKWIRAFIAELPDVDKRVDFNFSRMIEQKGLFEGEIELGRHVNDNGLVNGLVNLSIYGGHHDYVFMSYFASDERMVVCGYKRNKKTAKEAAQKAREWLTEMHYFNMGENND